MKIRYFVHTGKLLQLDAEGNIRSMTIEHASKRADAPRFSYEQVAA